MKTAEDVYVSIRRSWAQYSQTAKTWYTQFKLYGDLSAQKNAMLALARAEGHYIALLVSGAILSEEDHETHEQLTTWIHEVMQARLP